MKPQIVADLESRGGAVFLQDGRIRVRLPEGTDAEEVRAAIHRDREATLKFLKTRDDRNARWSSLWPRADALERSADLPLSYAQERLWFLDQLGIVGSAYNVSWGLRLEGELDEGALERSFAHLIGRHESLRTRFEEREGVPRQVIEEANGYRLERVDLRQWPEDERDSRLQRLLQEEREHRFDLKRGELVRTTLVKIAEREHALLLTLHHIVTDGWSMGIVLRELGELYEGELRGAGNVLGELPVQYADYALWQKSWLQGEELQRHLKYWREQLSGATVLSLPTDRARPAVASFRGAGVEFGLGEELSRELSELAKREGVTLFMLLLCAYQVLLSRYSGQKDIVVGTPVAGRAHPRTEELIGFFVNTLVLRTDLSGDPTFRELLGRVKEMTLDAYAHQDLPFEKLVAELQPERTLSTQPLFQVLFALENSPGDPLNFAALTCVRLSSPRVTTHFDLALHMRETPSGLLGSFQFATDLFEKEAIEGLAGCLRKLLASVVADPQAAIGRLSLMSAKERERVCVDWNATRTEYPRASTVGELFHEQARLRPEAVALVEQGQRMSYGELDRLSSDLAQRLKRMGVGPEVVVALYMERSIDLVLGMLAILKAGGAYLPLDMNDPVERLRAGSSAHVWHFVLTRSRLADALSDTDAATIISLDDQLSPVNGVEPTTSATGANLAYVMYTSGSTGRPKGVGVTHANVIRLVRGIDYVQVGPSDVVLQLAPAAFDASTFEIWGALLNGAQLVLYPPEAVDLGKISELIGRYEVSVLWLTAGLFNQMVDEHAQELSGVREILAGGDALSSSHVRRLLERKRSGRVINGYGPTECTTFSTSHAMEEGQGIGARVPIGRPIANARVYTLDEELEPVPIGMEGELYIAGDGVARGYVGRGGLTAERFVANPFGVGERLYRTGDRARWHPEGRLEFLGRLDRQVKLHGYRVEPGEIESVLQEHAGVQLAVVVVREDVPDEKTLVAYIVGDGTVEPDVSLLEEYLTSRLPRYMVPTAIVPMAKLPLMANGKVDRAVLPMPQASATEHEYVAPRTQMEEQLARIWASVLRVERIGAHDNFFELGGHSLLATRVVAHARELFGLELSVRMLFEHSTLEQCSEYLENLRWLTECATTSTGPLPTSAGYNA